MQVVLPAVETRATIRLTSKRRMNEDEYFDFCVMNPDLRIERDANGDIIIMPPAGPETGYRNSDLTTQITNWAKRDGRGKTFDSNTEFLLPDGSAFAPDACWIPNVRLAAFSKEEKRRFLPLCPDFVVELTSPSDRLSRVKAKMEKWIANGAQLGWLIDADRRTVHVYRPGSAPEKLTEIDRIAGEDPVPGLTLELQEIWQGL